MSSSFPKWLPLACLIVLASSEVHAQGKWTFLNNEKLRIGVNETAGAGIGWLSESKVDRNILNRYDLGRYVQQSWYGNPDGSKWNGKPWRWNPVQAGGHRGKKARFLEFKATENKIFAKSVPKHWATGEDVTEVVFEETITLDENVAKVHYVMRYNGTVEHPVHDQELPAVFVNPDFPIMSFIKPGDDKPSKITPGWPNERHAIFNEWVAYLNKDDYGIGIHVPGIKLVTCYRYTEHPVSSCSYVAPLKQMAVKPGMVYEYDVYLTIGSLAEIRHRFAQIREGKVKY